MTNENENTIRLTLEGGTWFANYHGEHAADVQRLFGTTRIPTAFTVKSSPEQVTREIKSRNPGARVIVGAIVIRTPNASNGYKVTSDDFLARQLSRPEELAAKARIDGRKLS